MWSFGCTAPIKIHAASLSVSLSVGLTYFSVQGSTSPDALITLKESGTAVATTVSASDGSFAISSLGEDGTHTYELYATDTDGLVTPTLTYTVALSPGTTTKLTSVVLPPTLLPDTVDTTIGHDIVIRGRGVPWSTITIFFANALMATTQVDGSGLWWGRISTTERTPGVYTLTTKNSTTPGNYSADSEVFMITLRETIDKAKIAPPTSDPSLVPAASDSSRRTPPEASGLPGPLSPDQGESRELITTLAVMTQEIRLQLIVCFILFILLLLPIKRRRRKKDKRRGR